MHCTVCLRPVIENIAHIFVSLGSSHYRFPISGCLIGIKFHNITKSFFLGSCFSTNVCFASENRGGASCSVL